MLDDQYNVWQYFGSWSIMVLTSLWIAFEITLWAKFLNGVRTWFFRGLISLLLFYAITNGIMIVLGLSSYYTGNYKVNPFNWISLVRMYSHVLIPLGFAVMMRYVNYVTGKASIEDRNIIQNAGWILAYSDEQRQRSKMVREDITRYIHESQ